MEQHGVDKSGKSPPLPLSSILSLLQCLLTCRRLWWECPDLCKKSPHCSPMTVSLTIHYGWIPEDSLSFWPTVHAETLKCWCCVFECSFWKAWKCKWGNSSCCIKRLRVDDDVVTETLFYCFLVDFTISVEFSNVSKVRDMCTVSCFSQIHSTSLGERGMFSFAYETTKAVNIHFYLSSKLFMSIFPTVCSKHMGTGTTKTTGCSCE